MATTVKTDTICVIGAGYVGLPLARALADSYPVISYDIDERKINRLSAENGNLNHIFTADAGLIAEADYILVCVPTPLSEGKRPDMSYIKEAGALIGRRMKKGVTVVLESSVYPGATEELFKPILEQVSGYVCGRDFHLAYSPERINPGDTGHGVDNVTKVLAAADRETLDRVADLYRHFTPNVFKVRDIRTAEAAKLVENTQRDLEIALVNELAMLFQKMGISTQDVLDAAATKWNFHRLSPGMVGGYCIPVVPYFLVQKAEEYGYHPQMILAGRAVNDLVPLHIADMTVRAINEAGKTIKGSKVLIMGCTYKENVADMRQTPVRAVIKALLEYGVEIFGYDPLVQDGKSELGVEFIDGLRECPKVDAVILAVVHDVFKTISLNQLLGILRPPPVIIDVRGYLDTPGIRELGIIYKCL